MDLHNYKRILERQLELIKQHPKISSGDKKLIIQFNDYLLSNGIGTAKLSRYMLDVKKLCLLLNKSVKEAEESDIRKVVGKIEQSELAAATKRCFKISVRKFYCFLRGITNGNEYPPEVRWISLAMSKKNQKMPEELLSENEFKELIRACGNIRDKALISVLAESGARVSEIGLMKIKHISFEKHGARLSITGKTGARKILVISSSPYLQQWLNNHPLNNQPDAFLWYNPQGEFLCYNRIAAILKRAARRAGINKRVYPHLLRHSRATQLAGIMSEAAMKQYFGWTQGSDMAAIYVHMSGKDTDEAILRANGIEAEKKPQKQLLKPIKCLRCGTLNETTNRFCKTCSLPLNEEEMQLTLTDESKKMQVNEIMGRLFQDPEVLQFLARKLNPVAA
ncbi:MAG: tyrosine-type recombinase/integrase [Victivallaceae bacterium]|nr:tyrosine-type recombinase/integrase [Victivallaceae bacterium]